MKLSIVIITYKRENELLRAVLSCVKNLNSSAEVIIIDNFSESKLFEKITDLYKKVNIKITYYKSEFNLGVSGGRNKGFDLAQGDYVFFLDDDALIESDNFFDIVMNELSEKGFDIGAIPIFEPDLNYLFPYVINKKGEILNYCGAAHVIRKEFWNKYVKAYPSKLLYGSEELYPSLIAWNENRKIGLIDKVRVTHLPSNINRYKNEVRSMNILLNTYIIRKLTYPRVFHLLLKCMFMLRIRKHKLNSLTYKKEIKRLYNERYDIADKKIMKTRTVFKLIFKFGLLNVF